MKPLRLQHFIPGIAWFFIVLYLTCMPGDDLAMAKSWLTKIPFFDKWVHVGLFGILCLLFIYPIARWWQPSLQALRVIALVAIGASAWGLAIEFIQRYWVVGRSFDLLDWAADTAGVLLAWLFCKYRFLRTAG